MSVDVPPPEPPRVRRRWANPPIRRWADLPVRIGRRRGTTPGAGWLLASRIVLAVAVAVTVMAGALALGSRLDDRQIDRHLGTATATVLSITALHTGIEFVDGGGVTVRPPDGVLYPGLLSVGQKFEIEYSTADPTLVRVAGRTAAVGNVVLVITLAVTWLVALAAGLELRRRSRIRARTAGAAPGAEQLSPAP